MENYTTESDGKDMMLRMIPGRQLETYEMPRNYLNYGGSDYDARPGKAYHAVGGNLGGYTN